MQDTKQIQIQSQTLRYSRYRYNISHTSYNYKFLIQIAPNSRDAYFHNFYQGDSSPDATVNWSRLPPPEVHGSKLKYKYKYKTTHLKTKEIFLWLLHATTGGQKHIRYDTYKIQSTLRHQLFGRYHS